MGLFSSLRNILGLIILIFMSILVYAGNEKDVYEELTPRFLLYEEIMLTQNLKQRADRLCHDNHYLYFIDSATCRKSRLDGKEVDGVSIDCDGDLKLVPLREVEKMKVSYTGRTVEVNRFYRIQTKIRIQLLEQLDQKRVRVAKEIQTEIEKCDPENRPFVENDPETDLPPFVVESRMAESNQDKEFVLALAQNGIRYVNSPRGGANIYENFDSPERSDLLFENKRPVLKTPHCNGSLGDNFVLAGGEDSGGGGGITSGDSSGYQILRFEDLQKASFHLLYTGQRDQDAKNLECADGEDL